MSQRTRRKRRGSLYAFVSKSQGKGQVSVNYSDIVQLARFPGAEVQKNGQKNRRGFRVWVVKIDKASFRFATRDQTFQLNLKSPIVSDQKFSGLLDQLETEGKNDGDADIAAE